MLSRCLKVRKWCSRASRPFERGCQKTTALAGKARPRPLPLHFNFGCTIQPSKKTNKPPSPPFHLASSSRTLCTSETLITTSKKVFHNYRTPLRVRALHSSAFHSAPPSPDGRDGLKWQQPRGGFRACTECYVHHAGWSEGTEESGAYLLGRFPEIGRLHKCCVAAGTLDIGYWMRLTGFAGRSMAGHHRHSTVYRRRRGQIIRGYNLERKGRVPRRSI